MPSLNVFEDINAELSHYNELYTSYNYSSNSEYFPYDKLDTSNTSDDTFSFSLFHINQKSVTYIDDISNE